MSPVQGHRYTAPILRGPESPGDSCTNLKNHDLNVEDCLDELEPRPFLFVCLFFINSLAAVICPLLSMVQLLSVNSQRTPLAAAGHNYHIPEYLSGIWIYG